MKRQGAIAFPLTRGSEETIMFWGIQPAPGASVAGKRRRENGKWKNGIINKAMMAPEEIEK